MGCYDKKVARLVPLQQIDADLAYLDIEEQVSNVNTIGPQG